MTGKTAEDPEQGDGTKAPEADPNADTTPGVEPSAGGAEGEKDDAEFDEVVLEDQEDSQPKKAGGTKGFFDRINRLSRQKKSAEHRADQNDSALSIEREKNKLMQMRIDQLSQQSKPLAPPDPTQFDGGTDDPEYHKAYHAYTDAKIDQGIQEGMKKVSTQTQESNDGVITEREKRLSREVHYGRAEKLRVSDYADAEDKAIEIIGDENVDYIIGKFPDSEKILYWLGRNEQEAHKIAHLIKEDTILAAAEIGALRTKLKVRRKAKIAPNPDSDLEGSIPSDETAINKTLEKLYEQVGQSGNITPLLEFKKKLREKAAKEKAAAG